MNDDIETFYPTSQEEWREWLKANHKLKQSIWLILYKKDSNKPTIGWNQAVDEALCFGWIDSKRRPIDEEKFMQFFGKRKSSGTWSKVNKKKVQQLIATGLMFPHGLESIETAKKNGSWTILDDVEELKIPQDLDHEFTTLPGSKDYFISLSKSVRKSILLWLILAKLPATRQKRISEIAERAAQNLKPKQFI